MSGTRTIEQYLNLPYHIKLTRDWDEDGNEGWVAEVEELPGCISQGGTPGDAVRDIYKGMAGWLSVAMEDGLEIPEPRRPASYSGKFVVRLPRSLHARLSRVADEEGVSLNQLVTNVLAGAVGWRAHDPSH